VLSEEYLSSEWDWACFWRSIQAWLINLPSDSPRLEQEGTVYLKDLSPRLEGLLRLLTGEALCLIGVADEGGWCEPACFLPSQFSQGKTLLQNLQFYLYRILYLSVQRDLNLNWQVNGNFQVSTSRICARNFSSQVLAQIYLRFPGSELWIPQLLQTFRQRALFEHELAYLWGRWISPAKTKLSKTQSRREASMRFSPSELYHFRLKSAHEVHFFYTHYLN